MKQQARAHGRYLKLPDAQNSINTVARMIYTRLFEWLISKINTSAALLDESDKVPSMCGPGNRFGLSQRCLQRFQRT